jgi:hypothetical protein
MKVAIIDEETTPNPTIIKKVSSIEDAETWIAEQEKINPEKVYRGGYGIDAPEEMFN